MAKIKAVLDTNILISALLFGGNPRKIFNAVIKKDLIGITSPFLIAELTGILTKKFKYDQGIVKLIEIKINKKFVVVNPSMTVDVLQDVPDNRVLEAAIEGRCDYIITGDRLLLKLKLFKETKILSAIEFINIFEGLNGIDLHNSNKV